jgi:DNA-binding CsgD family transcriptional regulator/PAS domain-containing protein
MRENEQLSNLIADIYDTVLDRSLWPAALKKATGFVRGEASAIFWDDAANDRGDVFFDDGGIQPDYRRLYFEKYKTLNPTATLRLFAEAGEPIATADLLPYDEFLQTRFYREWARPQGLVDFVSVFLEKAAPRAAMFGIFRHQRHGVVDEETRHRMRLVAPHIQRAVLIAKVIDLKQGEATSLAQAFDGLRAGVILVDSAGRVVHANAAAHALLSDGRVLRVSRGRLACGDTKADLDLQAILAAAALGDCAIGTKGILLPTAPNMPEPYVAQEPYVAHVLPLVASERRRAAVHHAATAAVFVHKAALAAFSPPEVMAEIFKLTMTELRVLFAIVEVGGVPEVAQVLGIAPSTVRTHLARVYEKTGVARQADLVKLVAGFLGPLSA